MKILRHKLLIIAKLLHECQHTQHEVINWFLPLPRVSSNKQRLRARPLLSLLKWHMANLRQQREGENEVAIKILPEVLVMEDLLQTHTSNLNPETGVLPCTHAAKQRHQILLGESHKKCECKLPHHRPLKQKLLNLNKMHLKMWAAA
jgi:hypothetical protein